jgi:hypothetical protein
MNLDHLSTSTPASNISKADFERMEMTGNSDEPAVPSMDDILKNSPIQKFLKEGEKKNLPADDEEEAAPVKSEEEEEVPEETSEETVNDSDEEKNQEESEEEEEAEDDQESTQEANLPSEEDIDWEYKIPVKIDGKVEYKTLEEVRKGYATDQHLSQKGREIGEARKKVEQEGVVRLQELVQLGGILHNELTATETQYAKQYKELKDKVDKAKEDGDTYTVRELKDQLEDVQEKYWSTRSKREQGAKAVLEQIQRKQAEDQQALRQAFDENIKNEVPDWDGKVAESVRKFALKEGLSDAVLGQIYDPVVVRMLNEYRILKTAKETGVVKRKSAPVVKSIPSKKAPKAEVKEKRAHQANRERVFSGQATPQEQNDFLKNLSSVVKKRF